MVRVLKPILKTVAVIICVFVLCAFICTAVFLVYAEYSPSMSVDEFYDIAKNQDRTTKLYYLEREDTHSDTGNAVELEGQELYSYQNREWVRYDEIPAELVNAFVSIEDHRFFEHGGVDIKRSAGAIIGFLLGKNGYGGSTITQQLIKNVTGDDQHSVSRKVREIVKAAKLDGMLEKEQILELYLNTIYLCHGCYGVGSASEMYFGKDVNELTLAECCVLACIPQSPVKWDPVANPENNRQRRGVVLERMKELGYIDQAQYAEAMEAQISVADSRALKKDAQRVYSWYTESVIDECVELLLEHKLAETKQIARKYLYTGGLDIITAQNPKMQAEIEKYFSSEQNFYTPKMLIHPQCSMIVIDPENGNVLAICGAVGEKKANRELNYATSTFRSPGSSIKPLSVYAPAIDRGVISYGSVYDDTPVEFLKGGLRPWPGNYPQGYRGLTTVRDAVARSVNTVAVKVLRDMGEQQAFDILHDQMGIKSLVRSKKTANGEYTDIASSPLALGQLTVGVTVKDLTGGYTSLAAGGVYNKPKTVLKILDGEGRVLVDNTVGEKRIFSEQTATVMTKLLQGVTSGGTANAMTLKRIVDCAGKTGTTNNDCDRWFVGYTPDLLAGVWFGYPTPKSLDGYPTSPSPALKTFDAVMNTINTEEYLGRAPKKRFDEAPGIITVRYCRDSGKIATSACMCDPRGARTEVGYFTKESAPKEYCKTHVLVRYDKVNKGIAGPYCPAENCSYVGLLRVKRKFPRQITISDAQYVYHYLPPDRVPCLDNSKPYFEYGVPKGVYVGKSGVASPFNCYCHKCYLSAITGKDEERDYEDEEKENVQND